MRLIKLTKISNTQSHASHYNDSDDPTEASAAQAQEQGSPVCINIDAIRCFYPRKNDRPGSRVTFTDGGGFAVQETFDDVIEKIRAVNSF